jgi:hypothetical protein
MGWVRTPLSRSSSSVSVSFGESKTMTTPSEGFSQVHVAGSAFRFLGWVICIASVGFAMANKSYDPPYVVHFWISFSVLVGAASAYWIGRLTSAKWRSKTVRSYFSPYIVGSTIWLLLFLTFWLLDLIAN